MQDVAQVLEQLRRLGNSVLPYPDRLDPSVRALMDLLEASSAQYRIAGGLATFHYGYRQSLTPEIDVLVDRRAVRAVTRRAPEHGFEVVSRRRLRHYPSCVPVHLLVEGDAIPRCDGLAYPSPESAGQSLLDARIVGLRCLIELKLRAGYGRDVNDVLQLLKEMDRTDYTAFESGIAPDLRSKLTALRSAALEELEHDEP